MRPIDADAALKALRKCQAYLYDARDPELKIELSSAEAAINSLPTIQPEKAQISREGTTKDTTSDLISRMETVEHLRRVLDATVPITDYDEGFVDGVEFGVSTVSTIQPEPAIPLSWIEKHIEWHKSLDSEFANLAAAHISVMVKKWRDEQNEQH